MKRLTAIWLLISLILAQTELNQLLKLPVLFQHFQEHQQENAVVSVKDFLVMHYLLEQVKDQDYDRDMQLPFKSENPPILTISSAVITAEPFIVIHFTALNPRPSIRYSDQVISRTPEAIWQPPQITC